MNHPAVTIIVLNLDGYSDTERCLRSLRNLQYPNFQVIVVDNGSTENDVELIRKSFPEVRVLPTGKNIGFASGNNIGIQVALREGAEYVFLLNNDTEIFSDTLHILIREAGQNFATGIVGPSIYNLTDPTQLSATSGRVNLLTGISSTKEVIEFHKHGIEAPLEIQFVTGCAFLIKREVIERIGLLDEAFFLYYEESDWCIRAMKSGFRTLYIPQAKVLHKLSSFIKTGSSFQVYHLVRSKIIFLRKHSPLFILSLMIHIIGQLRSMFAYLLTGRMGHLNAVVSGTVAGLKRKISS